jgi:hypothetical protein
MIAYYVYDKNKDKDHVVLPDMDCIVEVDGKLMEAFIAVEPDFKSWSGSVCGELSPEAYGTVVATREEAGDVCILNSELWRQRMAFHLGAP